MATPLAVLSTVAGVAVIGLAARDVFDALFHPEGRGTFGRLISRAVWWLFRRPGPHPRLFPLAGPVALVSVIATWAVLPLSAGRSSTDRTCLMASASTRAFPPGKAHSRHCTSPWSASRPWGLEMSRRRPRRFG